MGPRQLRAGLRNERRARLRADIEFAALIVLGLALICAAPAPRAVLFLGDSVTAGLGIAATEAFPALIQKRIDARHWNVKVVNAGQSGDTSAGGLSRLDWLLKNRVDVLVLELGANDGLRGLSVESTRANLQAIIDRSRKKYPRLKLVIAGMKVPPNMGRDFGTRFEAMFGELARKNDAVLIPFILEGVGGERELNLPDGIHPNPAGHRMIADNLWKVLEPMLKRLVLGDRSSREPGLRVATDISEPAGAGFTSTRRPNI